MKYLKHSKDKNSSKMPAFYDINFAKITLGIKAVWKFMSEGFNNTT